MKKYNPHSNRTRSRLVPAPKSQKPLIVAAGTIRAGTVSVMYVCYKTNIILISNCHNSVIFEARNLKFCMEVHLDILLLDLTSNLTSDLTLTSTSEVKSLK